MYKRNTNINRIIPAYFIAHSMSYRQIISSTVIILFILIIVYEALHPFDALDAFVDASRCGVGLPSCAGERVRCINGYCRSDIIAQ